MESEENKRLDSRLHFVLQRLFVVFVDEMTVLVGDDEDFAHSYAEDTQSN